MAQRDPLVEYQREGFDMFIGMLDAMKEESVGFLFNVQVEAVPATAPPVAPVATPAGLAEFAAEAAAAAQRTPSHQGASAAPALRAKGIDDEDAPAADLQRPCPRTARREVQRHGGNGGPRHAAPRRRERREAARQQAKAQEGASVVS